MLKDIIDNKLIEARGIIGFYPCNANEDDDIEVYDTGDMETMKAKFCTIRQQIDKDQDAFVAMSDFIAPKNSGKKDYIGFFAVSAGFNQDKVCKPYADAGDDYNIMMVKTLTDRLAEAFSEQLHQEIRKETWGYSPDEKLTTQECLAVKYQGIRPAPGYPSQPDHTEKNVMWDLMDIKNLTGIELTEGLAMDPASSVCGLYFANPNAYYFGCDEICKDQVQSYSKRKGMQQQEVEKWLSTILSYDPEEAEGEAKK